MTRPDLNRLRNQAKALPAADRAELAHALLAPRRPTRSRCG